MGNDNDHHPAQIFLWWITALGIICTGIWVVFTYIFPSLPTHMPHSSPTEGVTLEFGRFEYGADNQTCRLGEIVLTPNPSATHPPQLKVKLVSGYANENEKYWVESRSNGEQITLLGANGVSQVFESQAGDKTLYLLQRYEGPGATVRPGTNDHYLRKMFEVGASGLETVNKGYLVSNTCTGFQSRD